MKLFVLAEDLDKPVELNPSSLVVDTVDQLRQVTGFKILFSAVPVSCCYCSFLQPSWGANGSYQHALPFVYG